MVPNDNFLQIKIPEASEGNVPKVRGDRAGSLVQWQKCCPVCAAGWKAPHPVFLAKGVCSGSDAKYVRSNLMRPRCLILCECHARESQAISDSSAPVVGAHVWVGLTRMDKNAGLGKLCHRLVSWGLKHTPRSISLNSFFPHALPMWSPTYSPDSFSPQVLILLEAHLPLQLGCFVSVAHSNTLDCFTNSFYWRLLGPSISMKIREG